MPYALVATEVAPTRKEDVTIPKALRITTPYSLTKRAKSFFRWYSLCFCSVSRRQTSGPFAQYIADAYVVHFCHVAGAHVSLNPLFRTCRALGTAGWSKEHIRLGGRRPCPDISWLLESLDATATRPAGWDAREYEPPGGYHLEYAGGICSRPGGISDNARTKRHRHGNLHGHERSFHNCWRLAGGIWPTAWGMPQPLTVSQGWLSWD
jgi:hypothetical protein